MGGVAIPERHARGGDEHLRLIAKQAAGCSFFVTQIVYDVNAAKDLISDYRLNVESVSIRKLEIESSVRLAARLRTELRR